MNDNYMHPDNNVIYVVENILGPNENTQDYGELRESFNSQLIEHCNCENICEEQNCTCLQSYGMNYIKCTEMGKPTYYRLNFEKRYYDNYPLIECNSLCKCSDDCPNRLVQAGPIEDLIICKLDSGKGYGLCTKKYIPKGVFICEYAGEIITKSEALRRHEMNVKEGRMNYIYCLNEVSNGKIIQTFIDPSQFGNIGRYINHSCEPNCIILPVRVDCPIPKLAIFSSVDIAPNTELTFDYGNYNLKNQGCDGVVNRKKCLCMSKICKGFMPFDVY